MNELSTRLHYVFRVACAMCFIGHGAFGIITKQVWCNYFGVFGIGESMAHTLMPWVGIMDITFGLLLIVYPMRIVAFWLIFWGLFTALLRPLSDESFAEFLERAGNYGAPFLLLLFSNDVSLRNLVRKIEPSQTLDEDHVRKFSKAMQVIGFTLLLGHGWLNLIGKAGLLKQYSALGFQHSETVALIIGILEIGGAFTVLIKPVRQLILILFIWKMMSELFYPAYEVFEWVERGGSYGVLLGLWLILKDKPYLCNAIWDKPFSITHHELELNRLN